MCSLVTVDSMALHSPFISPSFLGDVFDAIEVLQSHRVVPYLQAYHQWTKSWSEFLILGFFLMCMDESTCVGITSDKLLATLYLGHLLVLGLQVVQAL